MAQNRQHGMEKLEVERSQASFAILSILSLRSHHAARQRRRQVARAFVLRRPVRVRGSFHKTRRRQDCAAISQAGRFVHDNVGWNLHDHDSTASTANWQAQQALAQGAIRSPSSSFAAGGLEFDWQLPILLGQEVTGWVVDGGDITGPLSTHSACGTQILLDQPPAGAWARKPLIARGAASKADGQPDEVDDNEDDEVSKLAKEHDEVQSYDANQEITQLQGQKYAGSFLLEKSSAADFEAKLKLSDGPKEMLIARIKKLKAAAAIRDAKRKLDHAGASEDRIAIVGRGDMLSALVKMDAETTLLKEAIAVIKEQLTKLKDNQDRITMVGGGVGDMLKTQVELKANDLLKAAIEVIKEQLKNRLDDQ
ncbi:hypothetical protein AK812_SmicGene17218, partial [Symbiodinium microadriaticum]